LLITTVVALVLANVMDLTAIASLASITLILVYLVVNIGHLRLVKETGAKYSVIILATFSCVAILCLFLFHIFATAPNIGFVLLVFIVTAFIMEFLLQKTRKRKIKPRVN